MPQAPFHAGRVPTESFVRTDLFRPLLEVGFRPVMTNSLRQISQAIELGLVQSPVLAFCEQVAETEALADRAS